MRPKKYSEVKKALEAAGFTAARQKGSHVVFKNSAGKSVTVPDHGGTDIAKGTMRSIARQAGKDPEELFGDQKPSRGKDPMELLKEGNPPPGSRTAESKSGSQPQSRHGGGRRRGRGRGD